MLLLTARKRRYQRVASQIGFSLALLCLGAFLATESLPQGRAGAALFLGMGTLWLGILGFLGWTALVRARETARGERHRNAVRVKRRQRNNEERRHRLTAANIRAKALERRAEQRSETRRAQKDTKRREAMLRKDRSLYLDGVVDRLLLMPGNLLQTEIRDMFEARGLAMRSAGSPDFLLYSRDNVVEAVARIVADGALAVASDVDQLEMLRFERSAQRAYLLAMSGFSEEVVRRCLGRQITLVEAHLLAHWLK